MAAQIVQVVHRVLLEHAAGNGRHDVAGFVHRALARVDEHPRLGDQIIIGLTHGGGVAAHQVNVGAGTDPGAVDQRIGRERRSRNDVGLGRRGRQACGDPRLDAAAAELIGERCGMGCRSPPNLHDLESGAQRDVEVRQLPRNSAAADDEKGARVGARQIPRGQRGSGRGPPRRQFSAVDHGLHGSGMGICQDVRRGHGRLLPP